MKRMSAQLPKSFITPLLSILLLSLGSLAVAPAQAQTPPPPATQAGPAPTQPAVYFAAPANGVTLTSPFTVKFGVVGMLVKPAGDMTADTGHFHLIINDGPVKKGDVVPADERHIHYGKGQTETDVTLPPGTYALTVQFADGAHRSYGADMSKTITVTVK